MKIGCERVSDIRLDGSDPNLEVGISTLLLENNILHGINDSLVASPEQLAFMVALDRDQVYAPCSDAEFFDLMGDELTPRLRSGYAGAWRRAMSALAAMPLEDGVKRGARAFCKRRVRRMLPFHDVLPSRLLKRLTGIVLAAGGSVDDPWKGRRERRNAFCRDLLASEEMKALMGALPDGVAGGSIPELRAVLDRAEFARLACLAACAGAWKERFPGAEAARALFGSAERATDRLWGAIPALNGGPATILLLAGEDGGAVYDLAIARFLISLGHRVVYAVKDGFDFHAPTVADCRSDPALKQALRGACICDDPSLSKSGLLKLLREWRLIVVGDGTRERLNLLRVSVTFSRAWKEADLVLARGRGASEVLLGTSHSFTRDVLCWEVADGEFRAELRPRAAGVRKYSEADIEEQSDAIVERMREAKAKGRPVIFYSCVIGSIPGQTRTALRLARAIVEDMGRRLPDAYIVNPAGHFVEGMDGDDLMFMWERVQRSGLIDIWYFQTAEDVERGFALLGEPMPQVWVGKDATYSTGCTQEMRIALDVQKTNREMQILGPDPNFFFRRGSYGVGKYFDERLARR